MADFYERSPTRPVNVAAARYDEVRSGNSPPAAHFDAPLVMLLALAGDSIDTQTVLPGDEDGSGTLVPCLKVVRGPEPGFTYTLHAGAHVLGRERECELCFADDGLSRRHAKVVVGEGGEVQILDLGSHNGTHVDGKRVEAAVLREGSLIAVGRIELRFGFARVGASDGASSGLSKRELEVAQLVAQGLSNAAIGRRLHISPKTVTAHLTHIYDRLGFRTRAALVRYLSDKGLF
jgi:DNA-binding CsgD family transcriptional regulator